jgi:serine/threonine-protein kinase
MKDSYKILQTRIASAARGEGALKTLPGGLTPELLRDAPRRLAIAGILVACVGFINLVIHIGLPLLGLYEMSKPLSITDIAAVMLIVLSFGAIFLARSKKISPGRKLDLGLVYQVLLGVGAGFLPKLCPHEAIIPVFSWICVLILLFPVIVPNSLGKILVAGFLVASMEPLGTWMAGALGKEIPPMRALFEAFYPNYICVALTIVPCVVVHKLSREVNVARAMGSYRLSEQIGSGAMGEIWRGKHSMLAREAAIKIVRPEMLNVPVDQAEQLLHRFNQEAQATAGLESPHTVKLFDYGINDEGVFYYVMELLDGIDLETLVSKYGPVSCGRVIFLLRQVCHSLAEAHSRDLIHRDIKPANIFTCRKGLDLDFVKVLDFGLVKSRELEDQEMILKTANQTILGTPAFMAPEMVRGTSSADARADIYAVGCVAYWLLTEKLVFEAETPMDTIMKHASEEPVPPSKRTEEEIPAGLERIVMACLEKEPVKRPQSADELYRQLEAVECGEAWSRERAKRWWEVHHPEIK